MTNNKNLFLEFERELSSTYGQFCVWNEFNNRDTFPYHFWKTSFSRVIYFSVANNCLSNLAKLTEKQNIREDRKVLSIFHLVEVGLFSECSKTIEKIGKIRNKILAHKYLKVALNPNKFLDEMGLTHKELENLFTKIINFLDEEKTKYDIKVHYKEYFNGLVKGYKDEIQIINNDLRLRINRQSQLAALRKKIVR